MATENNGYPYSDRHVKATLKPGAKIKIEEISATTGSSQSSIVAEAVDYYLKNYDYIKTSGRQARNAF